MDWLLNTSTWYLMLTLLGVIFFPLSRRIFHNFYDQGYGFSKALGIVILTYSMFFLGTAHILPFTFMSLVGLLGLAIAVNYYLARSHKHNKPVSIPVILFEESMFLVCFFFWAFIRSREPSLHGLEKFMDYGFMKSALRGEYFPTKDIWLAGKNINYYYFGHISGAVLSRLSHVQPYIAYNLILAQLFALGAVQVFSLGLTIGYTAFKKNLKLSVLTASLASFLVNLGGNLHAMYAFTTGYGSEKPVPIWTLPAKFQLSDLAHPGAMIEKLTQGYWYPDATRFIPFTIHEFPIYSYVVADLHGHVYDIPFVLLTIAVLYTMFVHLKRIETFSRMNFLYVIFLGCMMSVHFMTNAFDAPIYLALTTLIFFAIFGFTKQFFVYTGTLIVTFMIANIPFSSHFEPFATGLGFNCISPSLTASFKNILGPGITKRLIFEGKCQSSPWWMLIMLWGFFWFNAIFLIANIIQKRFRVDRTTVFMLMLFSFSTLLILAPEFVYAKDIYPDHFRANTMFKLGYQAFIMMSIASAFTFVQFKTQLKKLLTKAYLFIFIPLFVCVALYPHFAINSYYGSNERTISLDGQSWILTSFPEYYEIINYLNTEVKGQPNILEAQGDSYTDYDVVSAFTGLPTVAGWWVHEWLWRGDAQAVGKLIPDIENIYQSEDYQVTKDLLKKYEIRYVIIGSNERKKYTNLQESKFEALGKAVFKSKNGQGSIYQIPLDTY